MLYTALTRAGSNWLLLGNKTDFALMRSIDPEDPKTINNSICNSEALASTMQTIVDLGSSHILTPEEVYSLFLDNFHGLAKRLIRQNSPMQRHVSCKSLEQKVLGTGNWLMIMDVSTSTGCKRNGKTGDTVARVEVRTNKNI